MWFSRETVPWLNYPYCKETFTHINTAVARQEFVCMASGVMITVGVCEKVSWLHVGKTEDFYVTIWCVLATRTRRISACLFANI